MLGIYYIDTVVDLDPLDLPPWIEERLQRLFKDAMNEPLPEEIVRLLQRLKDE